MVFDIKNRPAHLRRAIWFDFCYPSTSNASPNDAGIVIIVIIVIREAKLIFHNGRIIAQDYLSSADSCGLPGL
jgi:hypothetical protein